MVDIVFRYTSPTYYSLKKPDAYDSSDAYYLLKGPDAADAYDSSDAHDSLNEPDAYDLLKGPDAADAYNSLKGLISNIFDQTYKNKIERENAQLIFCSNSLLKLLLTTQNQSYPYSIGLTFIFLVKSSRYLTTLSCYLTTSESLFDDIESLFDDNDSINGDNFELIPVQISERKYS